MRIDMYRLLKPLVVLLLGAPMVLLTAACGADPVPCLYAAASANGTAGDLATHPACATLNSDRLPTIEREHLAAAHFDDGLASMGIDEHWYYVRPDGAAVRALPYDNGPDPFSEGLFRSPRDGQIAFLDRQLEEVFETRHDWAWPFDDGVAVVCRGCGPKATDGEHTEILGGAWGFIDRTGREIVAVEHDRERAYALHGELKASGGAVPVPDP